SLGGRLASYQLKHYRTAMDPQSPPLELVSPGAASDLPLGVVLRGATSSSDRTFVYRPSVPALALADAQTGDVVLRGEGPDGIVIEKRFAFDAASYAFRVSLSVTDPKHLYGE